jgi:hypothetical protein
LIGILVNFEIFESLHIGINLKPHDYVLIHLTLN